MIGYSDEDPDRFVRSRGKIQCRYNVRQIPNPHVAEGGPENIYQFDYFYADVPTKESVLKALNDASVGNAQAALDEMLGTEKDVRVTEMDPVTLKPIRPKD